MCYKAGVAFFAVASLVVGLTAARHTYQIGGVYARWFMRVGLCALVYARWFMRVGSCFF
jgi:hypothetical protein